MFIKKDKHHTNIIQYIFHSLFFGAGYMNRVPPLSITSVIIQESLSNLEAVVTPITIFDSCISDNIDHYNDSMKRINRKHISLLKELFSCVSPGFKEEKSKVNPYALQTFRCFLNHKQKISIHLGTLDFLVFKKT